MISLDLAGVISLLSGGVATGSLKLVNANRWRMLTSALVVPGLYGLCSKIMRRRGNFIALTLSPDDREDIRAAMGLSSSRSYRYVGTTSGTSALVGNALFESWINMQNKTDPNTSRFVRHGANLGTPTVAGFVTCAGFDPLTAIEITEVRRLLLSLLVQAAAITVLVLTFIESDVVSITVQATNMVVYLLVVVTVSATYFKIPRPTPANGVPPGNMIVANYNSESLWAVKSESEVATQSLARCEVVADQSSVESFTETLFCMLGCVVSIATVLLVPTMSDMGKVYMTVQYAIGLAGGLIFSSRDKDKTIFDNFTWYTMDGATRTRFTNRATAAAAMMQHTRANSLYIKDDIVPSGGPWAHFRSSLDDLNDDNLRDAIVAQITALFGANYSLTDVADVLSRNVHGLAMINGDYNTFPRRLVADIAEAFAFVQM